MSRPAVMGSSAVFRDVLATAARAARSSASVLVCGETGAGKEVLARTVHALSGRRGAFVPVDCSSISDRCFDRELFGERGPVGRGSSALEGSARGKLRLATGGTLFLDGIDALSLRAQALMLRAIEGVEGPVDRDDRRPKAFRLVTSATPEFEHRLASGDFRRDLYGRVNTVRLQVPPLRSRREDIAVLASHFMRSAAQRFGKPLRRIDGGALAVLSAYEWPGNVRELEDVMGRAVAVARGEILHESDLPVDLRVASGRRQTARCPTNQPPTIQPPAIQAERTPGGGELAAASETAHGGASEDDDPLPTFAEQVSAFKRELLAQSLARNGWSYRAAGEELGLAHHQVKYLAAKLGVRRARLF